MEVTANEIHSRLLNLMKIFHEFCRQNNIEYYMVGGTMLGAKRHKGFIPWDDDVDVAVPRPDYDRLISLRRKLPKGYEFSYYKDTTNSPMHYIKLIDTNTTLIEKFYDYIVEGLYIDVFPFDGAFQTRKKDKQRQKRIFELYRRICWHCNTEPKQGIARKAYKSFCNLCNLEKMHAELETLLHQVGFEEGDCVVNFFGAYRFKEFVPMEFLGTPRLYEFEDTAFFGPEKADEYLTHIYGNYMELPPENKRMLYHNYPYINLNKPYKEYKNQHINHE